MKTETQKEKILKLLTEAGSTGINSFGVARDLALQLPTRIWELKQQDYEILSIDKEDGSVDYVLNGLQEKREWKWEFEGTTAKKVYI